jgi:carboxyl-terminal processing protease
MSRRFISGVWAIFATGAALGLSGCGGGGGGDTPAVISSGNGYVAGIYAPASQFRNQCANPRVGSSPITGVPYPDRPGSTQSENLWLRSLTNDTYLWYREVPDINPTGYSTAAYFSLLKTSAITSSGRPKDQYHFTYPTNVWESLAGSGVEVGHGIEWVPVRTEVPRNIVVGYVHPNTPATQGTSIVRGERIVSINGANIDAITLSQISSAIYPATVGQVSTFTLSHPITGALRSVTLQASAVTLSPVMNVTTLPTVTGPVGYLQFNDHLAQSELALIEAIETLSDAGVNDLVIDIRYNGGGYLDIASELAFMIAGETNTAGLTFEAARFNDKHPTVNPVTGETILPTPFYATAQDFSAGTRELPSLNLSRVYLITGSGTCSASESLINGLRGIDIEVHVIGGTTCGKPYGFYGIGNCGTTYFTIQMQTVNAQGFGEYADGFSPANTVVNAGERIPGCSVAEDFTHALGDPQEARLSAVLNYRIDGNCPLPPSSSVGMTPNTKSALQNAGESTAEEERVEKSPLRDNKWYR